MAQQLINQYHFLAKWGGKREDFLEISGLDISIDIIPMREGNSKVDSPIKIPGLKTFPEIIFKRNINLGDNDFYDWITTRNFGTVERRTIEIFLLDENLLPVITWRALNCFPSKYYGPVLIRNDSQIATETLYIAHDGFTVEHSRKK